MRKYLQRALYITIYTQKLILWYVPKVITDPVHEIIFIGRVPLHSIYIFIALLF